MMRAGEHRTIRQVIPVRGIDLLLHEQLARPARGVVHSVYRRAMNIRTEADELITVLAGDLRGPNHLSIPPETAPLYNTCSPGDRVDATRNLFVLHTLRGDVFLEIAPHSAITQGDSGKWEVRPDCFDRNCVILESLREGARCSSAPRHDTVPAAVAALQKELSRRIELLCAAISSGLRDDIEIAVTGLIGTGEGTTPAGDDILLGSIAGLTLISEKGSALMNTLLSGDSLPGCILSGGSLPETIATLGEMIRKHRGRTTFVSSQMLEYGTRGRVIGLLEDLVEALCTLTVEPFGKRLADLCNYGASSGRYMAEGLSIACGLINRACRSEDTNERDDRVRPGIAR